MYQSPDVVCQNAGQRHPYSVTRIPTCGSISGFNQSPPNAWYGSSTQGFSSLNASVKWPMQAGVYSFFFGCLPCQNPAYWMGRQNGVCKKKISSRTHNLVGTHTVFNSKSRDSQSFSHHAPSKTDSNIKLIPARALLQQR